MAKSQIDPAKITEIEKKVKRILKLIKDGDLVMDGTPEEILKREPLAEFVINIASMTDELNVLRNKVDSLQHQNSVLEAQNVENLKLNQGFIPCKMQLSAYFKGEAVKNELAKGGDKINANFQKLRQLQDKVTSFTTQVNNMEKNLFCLQNTKEELELCCKKLIEENELANKVLDLKRTLKDKENKNQMVDGLKDRVEDPKSYVEEKGNETSTLLENVVNHEEELRQKLQNTKQLLSEKEESFRKVQEELQQVLTEFNENMEAIDGRLKKSRGS